MNATIPSAGKPSTSVGSVYHQCRWLLAAALLLFALGACAPQRANTIPWPVRVDVSNELGLLHEERDLKLHSVFVDKFGHPISLPVSTPGSQLRESGRTMNSAEYDAYLREMMDAIRATPGQPILLYAHGGLTTLQGSRDEGVELLERIDGYYPIFLNWHSSLPTTLWEHVWWVRQGQRQWWAPVTSPVIVASDLLSTVGGAFGTWANQISDGIAPVVDPVPVHDSTYRALRKQFDQADQIRVSRGDVNLRSWWLRVPPAVLLSPARMVFAPFLAGFGSPAWSNMLRRIDLLFRAEDELVLARQQTMQGNGNFVPATGAVSILLDSLAAVLAESPGRKVVLLGHSMGAIVMDKTLERYPDLPVSDIVYMAPANAVSDLQSGVIPYLVGHDSTRFYVLTLHERAEQREKAFGTDLLPGGSLLEWLDDYLVTPHNRMDRRLGKWKNAIEHHYIYPTEVRDRVYIKGFGIGDATVTAGNKPTRHGHFNDPDVPFWTREFWEPIPR